MIVTFAFRKNAPGFVSWAIRFVTKSQDGISHVELHDSTSGMSFSSREPKGTSWKRIDYLTGQWVFCRFSVSEEAWQRVLRLCQDLDGKPYDFLGLARLYVVKSRENGRQFCSEVCTRAAQLLGLARNLDPNLTSPQRLLDVLAAHDDVEVWSSKDGVEIPA